MALTVGDRIKYSPSPFNPPLFYTVEATCGDGVIAVLEDEDETFLSWRDLGSDDYEVL